MGPQLRGALLAGFISSTIWMFIATAVDMSKNSVLIGGIVLLLGVAAITAVISHFVDQQHAGTR